MPSNLFNASVRLKLEKKARSDFVNGKVTPQLAKRLEAIANNYANGKLTEYSGIVQGALNESLDELSNRLVSGFTGLTPALNTSYVKYQKSRYPAYMSKFWRYTGETSVAFKIEKNKYLLAARASKPTFTLLHTKAIPKGKQYSFRLATNIPKWQILGLEQMLIDPLNGIKTARTEKLPYGLRTLVFNEEGAFGRGSRGYQPARPVLSKYFQVWNSKLARRLGTFRSSLK